MVQLLRALTALVEDLRSVPGTHSCLLGIRCPLLLLKGSCMYVVHINKHINKTASLRLYAPPIGSVSLENPASTLGTHLCGRLR